MMRAATALPPVLGLLLLAGAAGAVADHGGGTSGGCTGDCVPPTLGTDNGGKRLVSGGFAVNGNAFDVTYFKQDIPTQEVAVGEPVTVTLTVFEDAGPQFLRHVGLMMGLEDRLVAGVMTQTYLVQVHWERDFAGDVTVRTDDPGGLVRDVGVEEAVEGDNSVITFEFTPAREFDAGTVVVQTWDAERNQWKNYFYGPLGITAAGAGSAGGTVPEWVKANAGWWAEGSIDDGSFVRGLQYLVRNGIIDVPPAAQGQGQGPGPDVIPEWVKANAGWWAEGSIDDGSFVRAIQYLITAGIIET